MKSRKIPVIILVLISAGIAIYLTRDTLTPYVPFDKARESGSSVQIIGKHDKTRDAAYEGGFMFFNITDDKGGSMLIRYKGARPANFDEAEQIVVIGAFNKELDFFDSEKILTKCPSKYEKKNKPE